MIGSKLFNGVRLKTSGMITSTGAKSLYAVKSIGLTRGYASLLGNLSEVPNAYTNGKRLGRGPGSGKGKTAGRGQKGQKARGKAKSWFEGGQTPIYKLFPKIGFKSSIPSLQPLNLWKIQHLIDNKRIDPSQPITMRTLYTSGALSNIKYGVKLVAHKADKLTTKIDITASGASQAAIEKIEQLGGSFTAHYYTKFGIRTLVHPHAVLKKYGRLPLRAKPISRKHIEYYRDPSNRGYYQHTPAPGILPPFSRKSAGIKESPLKVQLRQLESKNSSLGVFSGFESSQVVGRVKPKKK